MHTTWRCEGDPGQLLDLLQQRLATAADVTAVERDGWQLVVRSRDVPTWAYLVSLFLTPFPIRAAVRRARTDRELRITADGAGDERVLKLDGDANAAVSKVLVTTSHELFPEKVAALDEE